MTGDMRWFRYTGDGTEDVSGHTGWAPLSGSTISRGWNRFEKIIAISDNLRWYCYIGRGEQDLAFSHRNSFSGIQIGNGW